VRRFLASLVVAQMLPAVGPAASAQDERPETPEPRQPGPEPREDPGRLLLEPEQPAREAPGSLPANEIRFDQEFHLPTDLRGTEGDVVSFHSDVVYGRTFSLGESWSLDLSVGGEYSYYDFDDAGPLADPAGAPIDDLFQFGALGVLTHRIDDHWSVYGAGYFGFGAEADAEVGDALIGGGSVGFTWAQSPELVLGFGITLRSELEDDVRITPTPIVRWQFQENARLETRTLPQGFALAVTTEMAEGLDVSVFAGWQFRQWRLAERAGVLDEGILRDGLVSIGTGVSWRPSGNIELRGDVAAVVYRELEFFDEGGREIEDLEADPYAAFRLRLVFRF